ncbi:hypothetical protein EIP91_000696 [Steccherinum ochraceum]|uniref:Uncharacterized protein n=1 Tax=Steccherinum ochraceum TaxID=92696 RepID=A0A4V2MWN7_9APHY|nr:hypothetical protein EIP91_000696 [Steccherinum ochraceum]
MIKASNHQRPPAISVKASELPLRLDFIRQAVASQNVVIDSYRDLDAVTHLKNIVNGAKGIVPAVPLDYRRGGSGLPVEQRGHESWRRETFTRTMNVDVFGPLKLAGTLPISRARSASAVVEFSRLGSMGIGLGPKCDVDSASKATGHDPIGQTYKQEKVKPEATFLSLILVGCYQK